MNDAPTAPCRPSALVAILGTATEIGKTWFAVQLVTELAARGHSVAVRKPVQSYAAPANGDTDAELLAVASGDAAHTVCPASRWYPVPMAPPMAADVLGRDRVVSADLIAEFGWPSGATIGVVETVGGVRSPMSHDTDSAGFVHAIGASLAVLVADAGLGTINSIRLAAPTLEPIPTLVFLNRFDGSDLHVRNREWLTRETIQTAVEVNQVVDWVERHV